MDYQAQYLKKRISLNEAVALIRSGNRIVVSPGATEPKGIFELLPQIASTVRDVTLFTMLSVSMYDIYREEKYRGIFQIESAFYSKPIRFAHKLSNAAFVPAHLRNVGAILRGKQTDILFAEVSPMDRHGFFTLGPDGGVYQKDVLSTAKQVVAVVNPLCPRTFGDSVVHISEVDFVCEHGHVLGTLPDSEPTEEENRIADYIAELIDDGSTIQLGIGGIPNAVAEKLANKRDLGIHTEMMNDAILKLVESGAVTGKNKTLHPQKIITCFTLGSKKLYDFIDDNPSVLHYRCSYTNNPALIAQNNNMISVNTTLQVDLSGQCASESIVDEQISGTGGQVETAVGAQLSPGGKSIIALESTAIVPDRETGSVKRISKIVPRFAEGTFTTLARTEVDYVVTEYGIARLKGATIPERARLLINLAHPDFRDELLDQAKRSQVL
jgi:acyl-CoA hydrolase